LWALMNEGWPDYDDYQAGIDRQIPVVVLNRARDPSSRYPQQVDRIP
jgi:hypothetical protein